MIEYEDNDFCGNSSNESFYDTIRCEYDDMETFSPISDSYWPQEMSSGSPLNLESSSSGTSLYEDLNSDDVPNDFFDDFFNDEFVNGMINNINKDWIMKYDPLKHLSESSCSSTKAVLSRNTDLEQYDERFFVGEENLPLLYKRSCVSGDSSPKHFEDENNSQTISSEASVPRSAHFKHFEEDSNSQTISSEEYIPSSYDLEVKHKILARCVKTLEILEDFDEFVGYLQGPQENTYESPLHRIPIIRFRFTSSAIPFQMGPIFDVLQEIGVIEKPQNMVDSFDRICCVNCQKFKDIQLREKSVQCSDHNDTNDVGLQVDMPIMKDSNEFILQGNKAVDQTNISVGVQFDGCCKPFILQSGCVKSDTDRVVGRNFTSFEIKKSRPKLRLSFL